MDDKRITASRAIMKREGIDYYYIPTADFHESEYVVDYFKARKYMTGFTGSAGVAVIGPDEAWLWTDGRYTQNIYCIFQKNALFVILGDV